LRQLRLTRDTLEHLRRATQLEGAMRIFADLNTQQTRRVPEYLHPYGRTLGEALGMAVFRRGAPVNMLRRKDIND
jgi:hypothetical protein